jgi:hypothetical protein
MKASIADHLWCSMGKRLGAARANREAADEAQRMFASTATRFFPTMYVTITNSGNKWPNVACGFRHHVSINHH